MVDDPDAAWRPAPAPETKPARTADEHVAGLSDLVEIARGGDSVVYRARQEAIGRDVAVKVLLVDDPGTVARFQREVELTVNLGRQHPNIVTVLDTATTDRGRPCIVMDLFERGSVDDRLRTEGPLPVADVIVMGTVVSDALAFAHAQGVLHRDVKPQNILVLPTSYVLADFGIARLVDSAHTASAERFSYRHASPQVLDGLPPSPSDDIWSLGSTMFTLLDGRPPFASDDAADDTPLAYLRRVRTDLPRPLTRDDVPDTLTAVIARCLATDRDDRFPDAESLHEELTRVRAGLQVWAPGVTPVSTSAAPPPPAPLTASPTAAAAPPEPVLAPTRDVPLTPTPSVIDTGAVETGGVETRAVGAPTYEPEAVEPETNEPESGGVETRAVGAPTYEPEAVEPATNEPETGDSASKYGSPSESVAGEADPVASETAAASVAAPATAPAARPVSPDEAAWAAEAGTRHTGPAGTELEGMPGASAGARVASVAHSAPGAGVPSGAHEERRAPSALSHDPAASGRDRTPTGLAPGGPVEPPPAGPEVEQTTAPHRPLRRRLAILGGIALVAGVGLGGAYALGQRGQTGPTPPTTVTSPSTEHTVPTLTTSPTAKVTALPPVTYPGLKAIITDIRSSGTSIELSWKDPTQGKASFLIVQSNVAPPMALKTLPAGIVHTIIDGIDPAAGERCYVVVTSLDAKYGTSDQRCIKP